MYRNAAVAAVFGALIVALSPVYAQVSPPPRCSCSEGQELTDASKPTRGAATATVWNCLCGSSQCIIGHAPTARSELVMSCMSGAAKKEETPVAPSALQDKRRKSAPK